MIKLSLDESYCFDYLSILETKCIKENEQNIELNDNKIKCIFEIMNQIGTELYDKIINSPEYKELFNTNYKLFSIIDLAKKGGIDALVIDKMNHERFKIKKKMQEKFFGTKVREIKLGYEE